MQETLQQQVRHQRRTLLLAGLLICEVSLALLHMAFTWPPSGTYSRHTVVFFHLDREYNLPALFSTVQFLLLGTTLLSIRRLNSAKDSRVAKSRFWLLLALGAFFLAADELFQIHESLGSVLGELAKSAPKGTWLSLVLDFPGYYWVIVYLPIALPAALFTAGFLWRELGPQRWLPLIGIGLFFLGAVGLDFVEGGLGNSEHTPFPITVLGVSFIFDAFLFEELFEMLGVTLVLAGCLSLQGRLAALEEKDTS